MKPPYLHIEPAVTLTPDLFRSLIEGRPVGDLSPETERFLRRKVRVFAARTRGMVPAS